MEIPELDKKDLFEIFEKDVKNRYSFGEQTVLELQDGTFWAYHPETDSQATRVERLNETDFKVAW